LVLILTSIATFAAGCGTTRWSDTSRTATEQLLVSDAIDRAVSNFDLRALAGKEIYLDTTRLKNTVDADYLTSSLRQHALASGCILKTKLEEAEYVVEVRSGAVGTDRNDALLGVPATNVPATTFTGGMAAAVPEVSLWKKTDQRAVAKIALFAYNRETGRPVWQSGLAPAESSAKAVWVLGAGPFRRGRINQGMDFAGEKINLPLVHPGQTPERPSISTEAYFAEPPADQIARRLPPVTSTSTPSPEGANPAAAPAGGGPPGGPATGTPGGASPPGGAGTPGAEAGAGAGPQLGPPGPAPSQTSTTGSAANQGAVTTFLLKMGLER
jgi:hypothetical protein